MPRRTGTRTERRTRSRLWVWRRLRSEVGPYSKHILLLLLISLLATPLALITPLPLKIAVDNVLGDDATPGWLARVLPGSTEDSSDVLLGAAAMLMVLVVLLRELQSMASSVLSTWTGEHITLRFRGRLLANAQRVSFAFHDSRGTADSIYRIQYDAKSVEALAVHSLIPQITAAFTFASMLVVILRVDGQLAALSLTIAPLFVLYHRYFRKRMKPRYARYKEIDSGALRVVHESLGAFRVVKAFGREKHELDRFRRQGQRGADTRVRLVGAEALFFLVVSLTTAVGSAAVLFVGVRNVQSGRLTLGSLLLVIGYLSQLYGPLQKLTNAAANIQSHVASAERAFELLDAMPDVEDRPGARPLRRARGEISFRGLCFEYEPGRPVLSDLELEVPAGTRLGVAGRTGSGKTTLVSLLTRFYDPTAGQILLDGVDLRDYRLADLRSQFSIVLQEPVLFSASIADNIAYARPEASPDEIVAAAEAADAHQFVKDLPDGYDTAVGERGLRLSGGERQRIALARAFLRDAPILVLDEPTSSVDVATEEAIMATFERLMEGRTVLMIAHRLSTLSRCDEVILLEGGRAHPMDLPDVLDAMTARLRFDDMGGGVGIDLRDRVVRLAEAGSDQAPSRAIHGRAGHVPRWRS
ncbi:MAG: ABC transporter ATP-binding protein/permease [Acidimicrobiia bacterium]|nr:ABC transporter ATP-binding protein/permease [Acidimicrobiia bacterium]